MADSDAGMASDSDSDSEGVGTHGESSAARPAAGSPGGAPPPPESSAGAWAALVDGRLSAGAPGWAAAAARAPAPERTADLRAQLSREGCVKAPRTGEPCREKYRQLHYLLH